MHTRNWLQRRKRTFVDKVFALCDYYLTGPIPPRQSRHIYDLYKLSTIVSFDDKLAALLATARNQRKGLYRCLSAQDGIDIPSVLEAIIDEDAYRDDYENVTAPLLFEDIPYEKAVGSLQTIARFMESHSMGQRQTESVIVLNHKSKITRPHSTIKRYIIHFAPYHQAPFKLL